MSYATPNTQQTRDRSLTAAILVLWFTVALCASAFGVFDSSRRPPFALGAAALLPVIVFAIACLFWPRLRNLVLGADLRVLTWVQTWRVGGIVFLILYGHGLLPGVFAYPAGLGDMAVGVTAPWIAWALSSPRGFPRSAFVLWNLFGLADLVTAISLGVLASESSVGILAGQTTTRLMGAFPLSLIPTFFVPVLMILHLTALTRVHALGRERLVAVP